MAFKTILAALAVLLSATTVSLAQSMPNYGPNGPATGDSFGKPYSGAQPLRGGSRAYASFDCVPCDHSPRNARLDFVSDIGRHDYNDRTTSAPYRAGIRGAAGIRQPSHVAPKKKAAA